MPVLEKATVWMKKVTEKSDQYMYMDTYAGLLYKTGKYLDAKAWAEKAIAAGKKNEEEVKGTEDLLEKIKVKVQ